MFIVSTEHSLHETVHRVWLMTSGLSQPQMFDDTLSSEVSFKMKFIYDTLGYFDPMNAFLGNKIKYFPGWPKRYLTARTATLTWSHRSSRQLATLKFF